MIGPTDNLLSRQKGVDETATSKPRQRGSGKSEVRESKRVYGSKTSRRKSD